MVSKTSPQEAAQSNPTISIVIPTYNSAKTLAVCLDSIKNQDYQGDIEIIIADGGSTDSTLKIAQKYTDKIYPNPLKTGEAGKAAGVKYAKNEIIALIDSDNILPSKDWFFRMTEPFQDGEIAGTEPLYYTYRAGDESHHRQIRLCLIRTEVFKYLRLQEPNRNWISKLV